MPLRYQSLGTNRIRTRERNDGAAMRTDHALADGEAEAGALRAVIAALDRIEHVENAFAFVSGDAWAGVDHIDLQGLVDALRSQRDGCPGRRELRGIFEVV